MSAPSSWITRHSHLVRSAAHVLDLACGKGRHTLHFQRLACKVTAVDRDISAVSGLDGVRCIKANLEDGSPWPLENEQFDAVIVTNYLWRPLLSRIVSAVGPGGILFYETFARGNETYGRPSNDKFLLKPDELLGAVQGELHVVAYEHGFTSTPKPAIVQRICAVRSKEPVQI